MDYNAGHCTLCPRACGADRTAGTGLCGCGDTAVVAKTMLHFFEEPPVSGTRGSGAVFFAGCSLRCGYCQNRAISFGAEGSQVSVGELAARFLALQAQGAHNVNLVTAAHFLPQVARALALCKSELHIPVVYNSSGYERAEALRTLEDLVDVFLPDYKYFSSDLAARYSGAADYPAVARAAIAEMTRQAGAPRFDSEGVMTRGVLIRHLVLPGCRADSLAVVESIAKEFPSAYVSVMRQYTPAFNKTGDRALDRRVTGFEYRSIVDRAAELGLKGFMQEASSASSAFTPDF